MKTFVYNDNSQYGIYQRDVISEIKDCLVQKNEVLYGGKLMNIQDANLVIENTQFMKNYIY